MPRYSTRHRVEGVSLDPRIEFRGILCDLSAEGCGLHLDTRIPPGTAIEARCDIGGVGLRIRGEVRWAEAATGGTFHGVVLTGFGGGDAGLTLTIRWRTASVGLPPAREPSGVVPESG
ncbi:MAG: PilZ domain-containing protein [candidate division NC10 bacterium]|nr:PilZ domain-containing protein [candidate division NC10 bacterium]